MNNKLNLAIADKIREMRTTSKLTQQTLADRIGCTRSAYANYEQGVRELSIEQLIRICDVCGYDVNYVIADIRKSVYRK